MTKVAIYKIKSHKAKLAYLNGMSQEEKEKNIIHWIRTKMAPGAIRLEQSFHDREEMKMLKVLSTLEHIEFFENIDKLNLLSMSCLSRCYMLYKNLIERIDFSYQDHEKHISDIALSNIFITPESKMYSKDISPIICDFMNSESVSNRNKTKLAAHIWVDFFLTEGLHAKYTPFADLNHKRKQLFSLLGNFEIDKDLFFDTFSKVGNLKNKNYETSIYDSLELAQYPEGLNKDFMISKIIKNKGDFFESKELIRLLMNEELKENKKTLKLKL